LVNVGFWLADSPRSSRGARPSLAALTRLVLRRLDEGARGRGQFQLGSGFGPGLWLKKPAGGGTMLDFGYFTLSDNHYENNPRSANQFVADIVAEALHAEALGLHSAWIGEHHFNSLGVLSCPDLVLAHIAAKTSRIRLAPAVTVLPLHHPIRVAEQWASLDLLSHGRVDWACGRGYDRR
jgi:hypothetical protein